MGIFELFKKKQNDSNEMIDRPAWRNDEGVITCPGDSCPATCDDTCPIFLNTQAIMLMRIDQHEKAIPICENALEIAPDFYDVWNNLGSIYGNIGNYQKAYDCYKKARELNRVKPNPVYGLMMAARDLGKYEECLSWCDTYYSLSKDGKDRPIRDEVNRLLGKLIPENQTDKF